MKFFKKLFGKNIESDVKNEENQEYTLQEKLEEEDNMRRKVIAREESVTVLDKPVEATPMDLKTEEIVESEIVEPEIVVEEEDVIEEGIVDKEHTGEQVVVVEGAKEDEADELDFVLEPEVLEQQKEAEEVMVEVQKCYTQCSELQPTNTDEYVKTYWSYMSDWVNVITLFETKYPESYYESEEMIRGTMAKIVRQQNKWIEVDEEIEEFRVRESALKGDIEKFGQAIKILNEKFGDSTNWGGKKQEFVKYRKGLESRREVYLKEELQLNTKLKEVMEEHNQILKQVKFCWEYLLSVLEGITL